MKIEVLAEAEAELDDAFEYYAMIRPQLARDLLHQFKDCLENISLNGPNHPQIETLDIEINVRRAILNRFPYMIVFEVRATAIRLLAFAHTASQPNYWLSRTRDS